MIFEICKKTDFVRVINYRSRKPTDNMVLCFNTCDIKDHYRTSYRHIVQDCPIPFSFFQASTIKEISQSNPYGAGIA
jgi:hypothetical protein